jgi:hypothetical protein
MHQGFDDLRRSRGWPWLRWSVSLAIVLMSHSGLVAQDLSVGSSRIRDQNIFDVYIPFPDNITQFQLDASRDWDFDETSLNLAYSGMVLLFEKLTARNYHVHVFNVQTSYQFYADDEDESGEPEEDSSGCRA